MVAFAFSLLHGFGFAGALADLSLPLNDIPLALLFFNVGAEFGQLLFIAMVIAVVALAKSLRLPAYDGRHALLAATCPIGTMASFWLVERHRSETTRNKLILARLHGDQSIGE
jgi:polyferredoxin